MRSCLMGLASLVLHEIITHGTISSRLTLVLGTQSHMELTHPTNTGYLLSFHIQLAP